MRRHVPIPDPYISMETFLFGFMHFTFVFAGQG